MILDEAIKMYTSNAEYERTHGSLQGCLDFRQLAEWLKELKQLKEQTRWIPVSERLPEDHDWYVIVVKEKSTGYQYIPRIASHNHDNCWSIIDTEDADKEWLDDLECIAWMPLPQPYVPDTNDGKMGESEEISDHNMKKWEEIFAEEKRRESEDK